MTQIYTLTLDPDTGRIVACEEQVVEGGAVFEIKPCDVVVPREVYVQVKTGMDSCEGFRYIDGDIISTGPDVDSYRRVAKSQIRQAVSDVTARDPEHGIRLNAENLAYLGACCTINYGFTDLDAANNLVTLTSTAARNLLHDALLRRDSAFRVLSRCFVDLDTAGDVARIDRIVKSAITELGRL